MSDMDFEAGRKRGWKERDLYVRERQEAFSRSMFGWPLMAIGGLVVLWCGLILGLSGTNVIGAETIILLAVFGIGIGVLGWRHNSREREEQLHRIDDFNTRWNVQHAPAGAEVEKVQ